MNKELQNCLENLGTEIKKIRQSNSISAEGIHALFNLHEQTVLKLVLSKSTPDSVKEYVSNYAAEVSNLPKEYSVLSEYDALIKDLEPHISIRLNKTIKEGQLEKIIESITEYSLFDYTHLHSVKLLEKRIVKHKIIPPLIKFYKELFFRTSETSYLEKIGDLYLKLKDYENALENYFNYAEVTDPTAALYMKMAEVFGELKDIESKNMCLEQAKILEGSNV